MKLHAVKFGLALGIVWGVSVLLIGLFGKFLWFGGPFIKEIATIYIGYGTTLLGSIIGGLWALIDAFVGGWLIALVYNWLLGVGKK